MFDLHHLDDLNRRLQELESHSARLIEKGRDYVRRSQQVVSTSKAVRSASDSYLSEGMRAAKERMLSRK